MEKLGPETKGRWLVTTQRSQHIWDLDAFTYTRLPGDTSQDFSEDGQEMKITRVERYPEVGEVSIVFYDDPEFPAHFEQWRQSSTIVSIEPMGQLTS
jgi:hypothetical protein